ncbi:contactin-5-like isoform X1 [Bicyclus anynana]|uniref:Contactin-5-like isoform X1 n=1 Tax=Bicyclus anynana TaxID=110368 RepID=A0A6J1NPY4_BICAN|nr:contactin-5-like isoform X1 [Bicyclus anynana]
MKAISEVTEVPAGSTVVLKCGSNDFNHNFLFWILNNNTIIGPGNNYNEKKFKYEVLSGKLHIHNVAPTEAGYYQCISKHVDGSSLSVGEVEMIVQSPTFSGGDAIKVAAIIISLLVIIICAVVYYRLKREWNQYEHPVEAEDEDDEKPDGEEIYNRTTTAISQPVPGPSRNPSSEHLIYGIDNEGLDTDFNSVFENIQIKSPSLI